MDESEMQTDSSTTPAETQQATESHVYKSVKTDNFVNKNKNIQDLDVDSMTQEELIVQVKRLQSHVYQLKNLLRKSQEKNGANTQVPSQPSAAQPEEANENKKSQRKDRQFDFNKFNKRHVFIKFAYLGWNYHGFTTQEGISNTVEQKIFDALVRTKLIQSRETSNYHRCGRTDKGVSAFSQVISIDVRSNCTSGLGVVVNPESKVTNEKIENEINYVRLLNSALPDDIRVFCWAPIGSELSARFDCTKRIYRYYFPKGDLDIDLMREGGRRLVGEKDYRNFCKMDVSNGVVVFFRRISKVTLTVLDKEPDIYSTVELIVEGSSFLWHQIRCMVAILLLIGQKKEDPSIIDDLLDIEKYPSKPQYQICSEHPLVLFDCQYENIDWVIDRVEVQRVIRQFQDLWMYHQTQATIIKRMINSLDDMIGEKEQAEEEVTSTASSNARTMDQPYALLQGKHLSLAYVKLQDRKKAKSLDDKVDHYVKRRRLDANVYGKINEANSIAQALNIYKPKHDGNKEADN